MYLKWWALALSQASAVRDSRVGRIEAQTLVTDVMGLRWESFTRLTETVLKPLFLVSLRRSLFLVETLSNRVALALWEYAGHPEAGRARGLLPSILTHEQLAALVGASRPRVSLALKRLANEGLFVREGTADPNSREAIAQLLGTPLRVTRVTTKPQNLGVGPGLSAPPRLQACGVTCAAMAQLQRIQQSEIR